MHFSERRGPSAGRFRHDSTLTKSSQNSISAGVEELSAETLAALQAFLHSKDEANGVTEDFGLSQFWYTDETAQTLAQAVMNIADEAANAADGGDDEGGIAILCSPTCLKGMRDTPEVKPSYPRSASRAKGL
eukprot:scaffold256_cov261-Pinguiococcus_pyrenoidosus.AAC.46